MPCPIFWYQEPDGSMPAAFQMVNSLALVPELSPREMNVALASAIFLNASAATFIPLIPAGSSAAPTTMKSLYMTSRRSMPRPLSMKAFSSAGE